MLVGLYEQKKARIIYIIYYHENLETSEQTSVAGFTQLQFQPSRLKLNTGEGERTL